MNHMSARSLVPARFAARNAHNPGVARKLRTERLFRMARSHFRSVTLAIALAILIAPHIAVGAAIDHQLGEQDFADGFTPIDPALVAAAGAGEPFPFDGTIFGVDGLTLPGFLGAFQYTHNFTLGALTPVTANLTIGLIDHDSSTVADDSIDLFFDGVQQDDSAFLGVSVSERSVSVVTVPVPVAFLLDGSLIVAVVATGPGTTGNPQIISNSLATDFSLLSIEAIPEPSTLTLLALGGIGLLGYGWRRRRRA